MIVEEMMMVEEEIRMKKIFSFLVLFLFIIFNGYSEDLNRDCFDMLLEKNSDFQINYEDYKNSIDLSEFYAHPKPWDSLEFSEDVVFLKFYPYGEETSFQYEMNEYEILKYGSIDWPQSHENMFFEIYVSNPNEGVKQFAGCGNINLLAVAPYNLQNLDGDKFWGCPADESILTYDDLDGWFFKRSENNCYNYNNDNFAQFNVDRILLNDENLYVNLYEVGKKHSNLRNIFSTQEDLRKFGDMFYRKLANQDNDYAQYLKRGFLPLKWYYNGYETMNYIPLKDTIEMLRYPDVLIHLDDNPEEDYLRDTYRREIFTSLNNEEFLSFLNEIVLIDNNFEISNYRNIETKCNDLADLECIGKNFTKSLFEISDNVYAVNFFLDVVMSIESSSYEFKDLNKIEYIIDNQMSIYENDYDSQDIIEENKKDSTQVIDFEEESETNVFMIVLINVIIVLSVIAVFVFVKRKKFK